jgi:endonuclease YncB( thermonuclease family)
MKTVKGTEVICLLINRYIVPRSFYKASLERIVDGDSIRVILRLKGINAPERKTNEDQRSTRVLTDILKDAPFLVIKTIGVNIYGRYVEDIFFDESKDPNVDPQSVANSGVYLNQLLLLDKGSATIL